MKNVKKDEMKGHASELAIEDATPSDFCVETTVGEQTFSYNVRKGFLTPGSGC